MAAIHKVFPDQAYVDNLNNQLPQGVGFNVQDHAGQLILHLNVVNSLLNRFSGVLDPVDIASVQALPEIELQEQADIDEAILVAIWDRLDLIEGRLDDLENP